MQVVDSITQKKKKRITLCGMYKFQSSISRMIKHSLHRTITRFSTKQHQCHQVIFVGTFPFYYYTAKPHSWATISVYKQDVLHHSSLYAVSETRTGTISHGCLQSASLSNYLSKNWSNNSHRKMIFKNLKFVSPCIIVQFKQITNQMQQFSSLSSWRSSTPQHVSGVCPPIIGS